MSAPKHPSERTELETVICWPMIALGVGLAVAVMAVGITFLVLTRPNAVGEPQPEQTIAPAAASLPKRPMPLAAPDLKAQAAPRRRSSSPNRKSHQVLAAYRVLVRRPRRLR